MKFQDLKKNDIIFCESQNSRVIRLGNFINKSTWKGYDIFSKQEIIVTNKDKFKLVNETKKPNIIKMSHLIESKSSTDTLTEKEVFIVEFFIEELGYEKINTIVDDYMDGDIKVDIPNVREIKNYLNLHHIDSDIFIQYLICAKENEGNKINTSTKIKRVQLYYVSGTQNSYVPRYDDVSFTFYSLNDEHAELVKDSITNNPWTVSFDYGGADFGDPDSFYFSDFELEGSVSDNEIVID